MATSESDELLSAAGLLELRQAVKEALKDASSALTATGEESGAAVPRPTESLRQVVSEVVRPLSAAESAIQPERAWAATVEQLSGLDVRFADALAANTQALLESTVTRSTGVGSLGGSVGNWALGIATGGIAPLISGLVKLFSGGGEEELEPLVSYAAPAPVSYEGETTAERGVVWRTNGGAEPIAAPQAQPVQVTVQVQAMDSRSFLDRKDDIARAVRQAMLNSHPLNDVMAEL